MIKPGDRFYSSYFRNCGTVTKYVDDNNWWFILDSKKILFSFYKKYSEVKAQTKPNQLEWIKMKEKQIENEDKNMHLSSQDTCVCCGKYVVEGRMVCWACEEKYLRNKEEN